MKLKKVSCIVIIILLLTACFLCSCSQELGKDDLAKTMQYKGVERLQSLFSGIPQYNDWVYFDFCSPRNYDAVVYSSTQCCFESRDNKSEHYMSETREKYVLGEEGTVVPNGSYFFNGSSAYLLICFTKNSECYGYTIVRVLNVHKKNVSDYEDINDCFVLDDFSQWNNYFIIEDGDTFEVSKPLSEVKQIYDKFMARSDL